MSGEPILDALAEAAEAAAAVFRRRAAMARPLWPAEGLASSVLDRAWQMYPILGPEKDTSVDPHIYRLSPALQGAGTDGRQPDD